MLKKFFQEFKTFAMRGNVMDMAIGIIIGAAFGKIVTALVENVLMPPLGLLMGGVDFSDKMITLQQAAENVPAVQLKYGLFLNALINFIIVAFAIFLMVKAINMAKRKEAAAPAAPPAPTPSESLLAEIRDLLKQGK